MALTIANRIQRVKQTPDSINVCRNHGMHSVNVDLIYGLPKQNAEGFASTLVTITEGGRPRRGVQLRAPTGDVKAQKHIHATHLPTP